MLEEKHFVQQKVCIKGGNHRLGGCHEVRSKGRHWDAYNIDEGDGSMKLWLSITGMLYRWGALLLVCAPVQPMCIRMACVSNVHLVRSSAQPEHICVLACCT